MKALKLGVRRDECIETSLKAWNIFLQDGYLWLSFPSKYIDLECKNRPSSVRESVAGVVYESTLSLISWMHQRWFASRASVLGLFFDWIDIGDMKFFKKIKKSLSGGDTSSQTVVVFPDLWTLYNVEMSKLYHADLILWWWQSRSAKKKAFEKISLGKVKTIFTTHSWVFQNWINLQQIIVRRPHIRYYKNQQQPRYRLLDVIDKIASLSGAKVKFIKDFRIF